MFVQSDTFHYLSLLLLLLLLLLLFLSLFTALDHDQIVIAIRCYHHVIDFAGDSQESEIVLRIEVADQTSSSYRKLWQTNRVRCSLCRLSHCWAHNLWLVAFLHLCLFDNYKSFDARMLLNSGNSVLNFALYRCQNVARKKNRVLDQAKQLTVMLLKTFF